MELSYFSSAENIEGALYSVDQVIGKTLYAKGGDVKIKKLPDDNGAVLRTVKDGGYIGVVYSYLLPKTGRANVYWMFYDENTKPYYVEHKNLDTGLLAQQGALNVTQEIEEHKKENETMGETVTRELESLGQGAKDMIKFLVIALAVVFLIGTFIKAKVK